MNSYISVLRNYAGFVGRARRREFWMFMLLNALFSSLFITLDSFFETSFSIPTAIEGVFIKYGYLQIAYGLLVLIPALAVTVRRMHDIGKSGWTILMFIIPIVGWIWLIILCVQDSMPGPNQYGPNPKEELIHA